MNRCLFVYLFKWLKPILCGVGRSPEEESLQKSLEVMRDHAEQ